MRLQGYPDRASNVIAQYGHLRDGLSTSYGAQGAMAGCAIDVGTRAYTGSRADVNDLRGAPDGCGGSEITGGRSIP